MALVLTHLPGLSSLSMLEDRAIHQIDIRLHHSEPTAPHSLFANDPSRSAWGARTASFPARNFSREQKAIVNRTVDWSAGEGLGVTGPIEALVLTLAGRFAASTSCKVMEQLYCLCV